MSRPGRRFTATATASTRGQLALAGLVAVSRAANRRERAEFLDALGITEALGLPLPVAPRPERYAYGAKVRPGATS